jgi:serine/threonine-protein kinase
MPFVEGESLRAHLDRHGALPVHEAISILRDVARALSFAHERGVVHRDIKPGNILLSGSTACVSDFGIAKAIEDAHADADATGLTMTGAALGTPAYMSPEQAAGDSDIDGRADLYAFGVVAYEMLSGAPPFAGRAGRAMLAAHVLEAPVPITERRGDLSPALAGIVMQCLEKEPGRRPHTARDVLDRLDSVAMSPVGAAKSSTPARHGVAVLPFANLSAVADDEFFSDGITEDIITQLSQVASLKVISRTSVMQYKQVRKSAREIASELGVTHIVEGSVRRAGTRLRIVAQLIDAASDGHLWAQTFDRELTDVFAIQTEVAEAITTALESRLTHEERSRIARPPTRDLQAYNLFVLGRHHFHSGVADGMGKAAACFEAAIARDPEFAKAYGWLALVHMYRGAGYWGTRPSDAWSGGLPLATEALRLDPNVAEAHHALAHHAHAILFDRASAEKHIARALRINPNESFVYTTAAVHQLGYGDAQAAVAAMAKATELDPTSALLQMNAVFVHWVLGRYDQAEAKLALGREINPSLPLWVVLEAVITVGPGRARLPRPVETTLAAAHLDNLMAFMVAMYFAAHGDHATARSKLAELEAREAHQYVWTTGYAIVYGYLGELDRAFAYLERAYEERAGWITLLDLAPCFEPLRGDPRFASIAPRVRERLQRR